MTEQVTRAEFADLLKRLEAIDAGGTRGVAVLGVQLQEIAKDVAKLEKQVEDHRGEHRAAEQARTTARRWMAGAVIAAVAAVDAPMVSILLAMKGH